MRTYEDELAVTIAEVAVADEAVRAAREEDRDAVVAEALLARRSLVRARAIGLLDRGRLVPGLPLVVALDGWLAEYGPALGAEALDDLAARLGGTLRGGS